MVGDSVITWEGDRKPVMIKLLVMKPGLEMDRQQSLCEGLVSRENFIFWHQEEPYYQSESTIRMFVNAEELLSGLPWHRIKPERRPAS